MVCATLCSCAAASTLPVATVVHAQDARPALSDGAAFAAMAREGGRYPLFAAEVARMRETVDAAMKDGIRVPVPKDPGGGYTHEQHKRNYMALYGAGLLYRITGERAYADYARDLLLAYAKLYPALGDHPAKANESVGRLFWQSLNDSVWLVYSVQGYDAIRDTLSAADRKTIDDNVFRRAAAFLSKPGSSPRLPWSRSRSACRSRSHHCCRASARPKNWHRSALRRKCRCAVSARGASVGKRRGGVTRGGLTAGARTAILDGTFAGFRAQALAALAGPPEEETWDS